MHLLLSKEQNAECDVCHAANVWVSNLSELELFLEDYHGFRHMLIRIYQTMETLPSATYVCGNKSGCRSSRRALIFPLIEKWRKALAMDLLPCFLTSSSQPSASEYELSSWHELPFFLFFLLKGADLVALRFGICEWEVLIMCTVQYE
jgi:hypothetical protein